MRITATRIVVVLFWISLLHANPRKTLAQAPPGSTHVVIPNPTPRPPDLEKELGDNAKNQEKQKEQQIQAQLRAREIWLESNQLLLLAQQLDQEVHSAAKTSATSKEAAKVVKIQKLAQSIQDKMKSR